MNNMSELRKEIQAALNLLGEAKFVKAAEILFSILAQPIEENTDSIIIQYHEATIKRLETRIVELELAAQQALDHLLSFRPMAWSPETAEKLYAAITALRRAIERAHEIGDK